MGAFAKWVGAQERSCYLDGESELVTGGEVIGECLEEVQAQLTQPRSLVCEPDIVPVRQ